MKEYSDMLYSLTNDKILIIGDEFISNRKIQTLKIIWKF